MDDALLLAILLAAVTGAVLAAAVLFRVGHGGEDDVQRLRLEQLAAGQRAEAETLRAQLASAERALAGRYETNCRLREGSGEAVEFAIHMPARGADRPLLAVDAKFPVEDYERLLAAGEAGDTDGEARARKALGDRIKAEARSIAEKYIVPPRTVEFAVLYLPTDGLYVEVARLPGLIQAVGSDHRVLVTGPSLCPALLRTIHLGFLTLSVEARADEIKGLLGATRTEMGKFAAMLDRLGDQAGKFSNTIEDARRRTRAVDRKLRGIGHLDVAESAALLELEEES